MRFWFTAVLACFFAFVGIVPSANAAPPKIDLQPALSDALQLGRWQTAIVTLTNPDDGQAMQGEVQITVDDPRTAARLATYARPVTLPSGAGTVRVPVYFFVSTNTQPDITVYVVSGRDGNGDVVTRRTFDKIPIRSDALSLLVVSGTPDTLRYLHSEPVGVYVAGGTMHAPTPRSAPHLSSRYAMYQGKSTPVRVYQTSDPANLPERAVGLETATIVYLAPDVPPDAFSEAQINALRGWVSSGGLLVLSGDKLRGDERFRLWLPPVPADKNGFTVRKIGRGTVVALGQDPNTPNFAGTKESLELWKRVALAGTANSSVGRILALEDSFSPYSISQMGLSVLHAPGLSAPGVGNVGLFMLVYLLLLVPVNYFILKRLDKREWTWLTVPVLVLLFTLGSYWFGLTTKGADLLQNTATYIEMNANSGETLVHGVTGVFSPARRNYQVGVGLPDTALWAARTNYSSGPEYGPIVMADTATGTAARDAEISMWAMRVFGFRTSSVRVGDGIAANLRLVNGPKGYQIVGDIQNRTGKTLEKIRIERGGVSQDIPQLAPNKKATVTLLYVPFSTNMSSSMAYRGNQETKSIEDVKRAIADDLLDAMRYPMQRPELSLEKDEVTIYALNYDSLLPVTVDNQTVKNGANVHLFLVRAKVSGDYSKIRYNVPVRVINGRVVPISPRIRRPATPRPKATPIPRRR
jgi:hypothetical protein